MSDRPVAGQIEHLETNVRRILAPNPSAMTYWGTNTYLVGSEKLAVIDPGPDIPSHLEAVIDAAGGPENISHIIVTHAHVDHSAAAQNLSAATKAPIYAFGPATRGRSHMMKKLGESGLVSGGEGIDHAFTPDVQLEDGDRILGKDWELNVIWTPGHIGNHVCLALNDAVFSGDHVMQWATSIVSPPDGDVSAFMDSCRKLLDRHDRVFYPGHGPAVTDPRGRTQWLIDHRSSREQQVLRALDLGPKTPSEIVRAIYTDINPALYPAAERNVFAHIIALVERDIVHVQGEIRSDAKYLLQK